MTTPLKTDSPNWRFIDATSDSFQSWRRWGNEWVCSAGFTWQPMLTGGDNPRAKSVEDAISGNWAKDGREWLECDFEVVPCKAMGEEKYAWLLFKVLRGPIRGEISYVPCDYTGPDPEMRDVA